VPPFRFRDLGALVSLSDYNAFGTLGRFGLYFGLYNGGFIKGRFVQLSHAVLYRRHQLSLHGPRRAVVGRADQSVGGAQHPRSLNWELTAS
jgi:NADH:ubiquinone reductase (H+-translocating)